MEEILIPRDPKLNMPDPQVERIIQNLQKKIKENLEFENKLEEILGIGKIVKILNDGWVIGTLGFAKIDPTKDLQKMCVWTTRCLGIGRIDKFLHENTYGQKLLNEIHSLKDLIGKTIFGEYGAMKRIYNQKKNALKIAMIKLGIRKIKKVIPRNDLQPRLAFLEGEEGIAVIDTENFLIKKQVKNLKEIGDTLCYTYENEFVAYAGEVNIIIRGCIPSSDLKKFSGLIMGNKNICIEENGKVRWQTNLQIGKIRKIFFEKGGGMAVVGEKGIAKVDIKQEKYTTTGDLGIGEVVNDYMFPYDEIFKKTIDSSKKLNLIIGTKGVALIENNKLEKERNVVFKENAEQTKTSNAFTLKKVRGTHVSHDKYLLLLGENLEGKKGLCCINIKNGKVLWQKSLSGRLRFKKDIKTPFGPAVVIEVRDGERNKEMIMHLGTGICV